MIADKVNELLGIDAEFYFLMSKLKESGCAKKQIAAGTYSNGIFHYAVNFCNHAGETCPRLDMPSGVGYELCDAQHAERNLVKDFKAKGLISDGIAWVYAHYWACEPCAAALKTIGVKEIRVRESL